MLVERSEKGLFSGNVNFPKAHFDSSPKDLQCIRSILPPSYVVLNQGFSSGVPDGMRFEHEMFAHCTSIYIYIENQDGFVEFKDKFPSLANCPNLKDLLILNREADFEKLTLNESDKEAFTGKRKGKLRVNHDSPYVDPAIADMVEQLQAINR